MSRWCDRYPLAFPFDYCLVTTEDAYYEECRRIGISRPAQGQPWVDENANATTSYFSAEQAAKSKRPAVIVWVGPRVKKTSIQTAALLVHEAVHIFQHFCEYIGETAPSKEFEAYSIQWIAQELMEQYASQVVNQET